MNVNAFIIAGLVMAHAQFADAKTPLQASCQDFLNAQDDDKRLYEGLILGFTAAKVGYTDNLLTEFEASRVLRLTAEYCRKDPSKDVVNVIAAWSSYVAKQKTPLRSSK